ncbi:phage integrase N-terminal SAM-like domain-containing protein [Pseudomonas sp. SH1-B]
MHSISTEQLDSRLHPFHQLRHLLELGTAEVKTFLNGLAVGRKVAAATQSLALNALVFLYAMRPRTKRSARLPCVLTHDEAASLTARLGQPSLR